MAIRLKARPEAAGKGAIEFVRAIAPLQVAGKIPLIVIPNEARNPSFLKSQEKRDSPIRSVPRNDAFLLFCANCFAIALILFVPVPASRGQASSNATDADSAAIKQAFTEFYESFSHHNAHATAMTFAEDA